MLKKIFIAISIFSFLFLKSVSAQEHPNNKFGIHLAQPSDQDLEAAAKLVNSSSGDWGYVTLVIQENDRDKNKWQEIFNKLRRLHLIPVIRLATQPEGGVWQRPSESSIASWVNFLDSLNWVVKNRYVILFNEPNHGFEWGGAVDPENYAQIAFTFAKALKERNPDFFVMLSGFDAASPSNPPYFEDEEVFLRRMLARARDLAKNNNSQKNSNQRQRKSNDYVGINSPKVLVVHKDSNSNLYAAIRKNVPNKTSIVNTKISEKDCKPEKLGTTKTAAYQAAERLIKKAEIVLNKAFFLFFEKYRFTSYILAKETEQKKQLFDYIDGWVSHSYPKDYFGSPYDFGRNSVRTYQWELELLRSLGVTKELPVFITETGWKRQVKSLKSKVKSYLDSETIGQYFKIAFESVWLPDNRVWAVTPFVLNYQEEPFTDFSWRLPGEGGFYPQYFIVQNLPKIKGEPIQKHKVTVFTELPKELVEGSTYNFKLKIKNEGQSILEKKGGYSLSLIKNEALGQPFYTPSSDRLLDYQKSFPTIFIHYSFTDLIDLEPEKEQLVDFHLKTTNQLGNYQVKVGLFKNERLVLDLFSWDFKISPWPSLKFKVILFPKLKTEGDDFEVQIFDKNQQLVYKKKNIKVKNGFGSLARISNIAINEPYRVVVLKPYYLPRQAYFIFKKEKNDLNFKSMIPLDFNGDGRLSFYDFLVLGKNLRLLKIWWVK